MSLWPLLVTTSLHLPPDLQPYEAGIIRRILETGIERYVKPRSKRQRRTLNKALYATPEFVAFWNAISRRTTFRVQVQREPLIEKAVAALKTAPDIEPLRIDVTRAQVTVRRGGMTGAVLGNRIADIGGSYPLPDVIGELQQATSLTRRTLVDILIASGKLAQFIANPNDFVAQTAQILKGVLASIVVDGIQYEKIDGSVYELRELQLDGEEERERFLDQMYRVQHPHKTDFDYIVFDSDVERLYAELLDSREDIKLFMKLPARFKVPTPVGDYNPDWAIIRQDNGEDRIYLIRETKSELLEARRRPSENARIRAARKHFEEIGIHEYEVATDTVPKLEPGLRQT